jgi:hypothetical protein
MVIVDADIMIELLRGNPLAKAFIINEIGHNQRTKSLLPSQNVVISFSSF